MEKTQTSARIVAPTLAQVYAACGETLDGVTTENLAARRFEELIGILSEPRYDLNARFDAALGLREQVKPKEAVRALFDLVQASINFEEDKEPAYTEEQRRTGILSAIALQGQLVCDPDYRTVLTRWTLSTDGCTPDYFPDRLARGILLCSSTDDERASSLLGVVVMNNPNPAAKIMALSGLIGANNQKAGDLFVMLLANDTLAVPEPVREFAIEVLEFFRPKHELLEKVLRVGHESVQQHNLTASLALRDQDRIPVDLFERALHPAFGPDQADAAKQIALNSWRVNLGLPSGTTLVGASGGMLLGVRAADAPDLTLLGRV